MKPERRGALLILGVLVFSAVLGGIYGPPVRATAAGTTDLQDSIKNFTRVLSIVQQDYAIPVDTDHALYDGAIPGMLRVLDPHSTFFDPRAVRPAARRSARQVLRRGHDRWAAGKSHRGARSHARLARCQSGDSSRRHHRRGRQTHRRADHFGSRRPAEGPQGHRRARHHGSRRLRPADHFHRDARRDSQAFRGRRFRGAPGHRLHAALRDSTKRPIPNLPPRSSNSTPPTSKAWSWTCAAIPAAC